MSRNEADTTLHKREYNDILSSIRESRRGIGLVLLIAAFALLVSLGSNVILARTVDTNQQMIYELKTEMRIKGLSNEAEAIAPAAEVNKVTIFGTPGKDGKDGKDGADGSPGATGSPGVAGPSGPPGPQGKPGIPGAQGKPGTQGATGPEGKAGATGAQGKPGQDGVDGSTGPSGPEGPAGPAGPVGPQGEKGEKGDKGDTPELPVFVVNMEQGGPCSVTFYFSNDTSKSIDLCEGD
jgi:hypothetical protein